MYTVNHFPIGVAKLFNCAAICKAKQDVLHLDKYQRTILPKTLSLYVKSPFDTNFSHTVHEVWDRFGLSSGTSVVITGNPFIETEECDQ